MACTVRTSLASTFIALAAALALGACGGDDTVTVTDAAVDAEIDAPIDAPPAVCNPPNMMCGSECVDTRTSEAFCGNCTTQCAGGQECRNSACNCVAAFVPANPTFLQEFLDDSQVPGTTVGIGAFLGSAINALVVGRLTAGTAEDTPYTLGEGTLGTPPFLAAGYDVNAQTFEITAAFYATAGTITFTKICPNDGAGNAGGFSGTATDVTFSAVEGIMNPVLIPDGCSFTVATVSFSYGDVSCTNK